MEKTTGVAPEELVYDELSPEICYIWLWFIELHNTRQSGGFSASPISYTEIKAWSELTGWVLESWEVTAIKVIDQEFIAVQVKSQKKDGNTI